MTPPKRPRPAGTPPTRDEPAKAKTFSIGSGKQKRGQRVVIYGSGGIGKTSLASLAPSPVFLDLPGENGTVHMDVRRVDGVETFADVLTALRTDELWEGAETIVLDSGTALQELATVHVIATVPHEKGKRVLSIEDYGFGKGYKHVGEAIDRLLVELDRHAGVGRNIVLVCHDSVEKAPNPDGDDYLRYEPNLQQPPKTGRVRDRVKGWCDHLLFIQYDMDVSEDGKATGQGTRTIYTNERPTFWAKSRHLRGEYPFAEGDGTIWTDMMEAT